MSGPHTENDAARPASRKVPPRASRPTTQSGRDASAEECERMLDEELDDTFPASDPPSWTMGGSVVSGLRH